MNKKIIRTGGLIYLGLAAAMLTAHCLPAPYWPGVSDLLLAFRGRNAFARAIWPLPVPAEEKQKPETTPDPPVTSSSPADRELSHVVPPRQELAKRRRLRGRYHRRLSPKQAAPLEEIPGASSLLTDPKLTRKRRSLDYFHEMLYLNLVSNQAVGAKVLIIGDSFVGGDNLPFQIRRRLYRYFGYGGAGYLDMRQPHQYRFHYDVKQTYSGRIDVLTATSLRQTGLRFGISGFGYVMHPGAAASFHINPWRSDTVHYDALTLYYHSTTDLGRLAVTWGDQRETLRTEQQTAECAVCRFRGLADQPFTVRNIGSRPLNVYGVELARPGGIIVSTLSIINARYSTFTKINRDIYRAQMRQMRPDLVIFVFGTNTADFDQYPASLYRRHIARIIDRTRAALPGVSLMIMGPMGRAKRTGGRYRILPMAKMAIRIQQETAGYKGVAYYNLFAACGGEESIFRWYNQKQSPKRISADMMHLTPYGAKLVAPVFVRHMLAVFKAYLQRLGKLPAAARTAP